MNATWYQSSSPTVAILPPIVVLPPSNSVVTDTADVHESPFPAVASVESSKHSQPVANAPSLSAHPALHTTISHVPLLQVSIAFGALHALPHAPQLLRSFARSYPSSVEPSQSSSIML